MPRPCKNNCGQLVFRKSQLKCEECKKHKFWFVDIDEYNLKEEDPRKKLKKCECGHYYILWNQFQHLQSKYHKQYIIKRDNLEITIESPARLCTQKDNNNKMHGRWSMKHYNACPKCSTTMISTPNADVFISHHRPKHMDIEIRNGNLTVMDQED